MSGLPKKYPGVWQSKQPLKLVRYFPRSTCGSAAPASMMLMTVIAKPAVVAIAKAEAVCFMRFSHGFGG